MTTPRVSNALCECATVYVENDDLLCGDDFYRKHWRAVCPPHTYTGPWRFHRSEAVADRAAHDMEGSSTAPGGDEGV